MRKGQSLVEVFVALGVGILVLGGVSSAFVVITRNNDMTTKNRNATITNDALLDSSRSFAEGNWVTFYSLNKGSANRYKLINSGGSWAAQAGAESVVIGNTTYTRSFYVENVSRDNSDNIEAIYGSNGDDPSTQKITVETSFPIMGSTRTISYSFYVTRTDNFVLRQTDWSGGSGQEGPLTVINNKFSSGTNIDFTSTTGSIVPSVATCDGDIESCLLTSSTFDTGISSGAAFNTFMWQGNQPAGTKVRFKIAAANDSLGPWNFTGAPMKPSGPNIQVRVDQGMFNNMRYFRYRVIFDTAGAIPRVDDVIMSISR